MRDHTIPIGATVESVFGRPIDIYTWNFGIAEPPGLTEREKVVIEMAFESDIYPGQQPRRTMLQPIDRVTVATLLYGLTDAVNSVLGVPMSCGQTDETREIYANSFHWVMSDDESQGSFLYLVDQVNRATGAEFDPEWMRRAVRRLIKEKTPVNLRAMHGIRRSEIRGEGGEE